MKILESKRIKLINVSIISSEEKELLKSIIFEGYKNKVYPQKLSRIDINHIVINSNHLYLITEKKYNNNIGYINLSKKCFYEICLNNRYHGNGYSVEATILFLHNFFNSNAHQDVRTMINISNLKSLKSTIHFGWVQDSANLNQEWLTFTLTKKQFVDSFLIDKFSDRYNIFTNNFYR